MLNSRNNFLLCLYKTHHNARQVAKKEEKNEENQHIIVIFCIATNFAFHRTNIENVENDDFENVDPDQHIFFNDWYISEKRGKNLVARSFLMMDNDFFCSKYLSLSDPRLLSANFQFNASFDAAEAALECLALELEEEEF